MLTHNGVAVPRTLDEVCRPERMALLVYDVQVGITRQLKDPGPMLAKVAEALAAARAARMRVVYVRHASPPLAWHGAFATRTALAWQRTEDPSALKPWFLPGTDAHAIHADVAPGPDDLVLDKVTMSAFEGTPLAALMRDCGLGAFALVGAATEIGLEPTVRHAADLGLLPVLLTDACRGGEEIAAERAMASLRFMGDALFADVGAFAAALSAKRP